MSDAVDEEASPHVGRAHREGLTMALYVAICLLAALEAIDDDDHIQILYLVWGTTIGLALAHWFAFALAARYVGEGTFHPRDAEHLGAEMLGASSVAAVSTIIAIVLPASSELDAIRLFLAGFIGIVAYSVARNSGGSRSRALAFAGVMLVVALAVVLVKNALIGH